MFILPKNLKVSDMELSSLIQIVYSKTKEFLKYPHHIHYTDHSIEHSIRVINLISDLLEGSAVVLSDVEKYIIICSAFLHDIGMQTPIYLETDLITTEGLEEIRENHHEYSERMIIDSITKPYNDRFNFGLGTKPEYVEIIASVAKAHRKVDLSELGIVLLGGNRIHVKLLAALLRLCDCLDIDYRRVNIERLTTLRIPVLSKLYWFRHQYVQAVEITKQKICIFLNFPKKYENETNFTDKITNDILAEVSNQVDEVYDILYEYDIRLHKKIMNEVNYSLMQPDMPDELITYINTLCETNVVKNDKVFDVYPTRDICIDELFDKLKNNCSVENIVFFGGISTRLCSEETISVFSTWLNNNKTAMLFLCYEDDGAAIHRATSLDMKSIPKDNLPNNPYARYFQKLRDISSYKDKYPSDIRDRIYLIPITKALNTYPIIVDDDFYCNILTSLRSSQSTTAKMKDNNVGKKTKIELLSYMLFVLESSPECNGKRILMDFFVKKNHSIK